MNHRLLKTRISIVLMTLEVGASSRCIGQTEGLLKLLKNGLSFSLAYSGTHLLTRAQVKLINYPRPSSKPNQLSTDKKSRERSHDCRRMMMWSAARKIHVACSLRPNVKICFILLSQNIVLVRLNSARLSSTQFWKQQLKDLQANGIDTNSFARHIVLTVMKK